MGTFAPKGMRLHNPFNLERNPNIHWQGQVPTSLEPVFCEFESDLMGLRAGFLNLKNQLAKGYNTVSKLITKYAPPFKAGKIENDTKAYIKQVCLALDNSPNDALGESDLKDLGKAIIKQEQGYQPFDDVTLDQALKLAGVVPKQSIFGKIKDLLYSPKNPA